MSNESNSKISNKRVIFNWKSLIIPILLVFTIGGTIYLINISENWFVNQKITEYEFEGISVSNTKLFLEQAKKISFGKSKDSILLKRIETELEKDLYIKKCVTNFESQSKIRIKLTERIPFAFYLDRGKIKYIDEVGTILPYKVLKDYSDLILISGFSESDSLLRNSSLKILKVLDLFEEVKMFTSELRYINREKGFELIGIFEKVRIYLGSESEIYQKLEKLKILMSDKNAQKLVADSKYIDLRWSDRIVIEEI